jgi:hypothetical protein
MNSRKDGKFSYRLKQKIHQFLETKNITYTQVRRFQEEILSKRFELETQRERENPRNL